MPEVLQIQLLGGLQVAMDGVPIESFVSSKAPALLAYLAVTGRPHFRSSLAGLLWSDLSEEYARGNLRSVLANLRQKLPDHLIVTRNTIAFDCTSPHWLDVEQLEAALHEMDSAPVEQLTEAVALYTGDFLEGFYVRDAPLFDEWATILRERLRQQVLQALHTLANYHTSRREYTAGIDACTRMLAIDPLREEAHRQLMVLLAQSGQRGAALAQYETCRQMLSEEFGAEPSPETEAVYKQIHAGEIQARATVVARQSQLPAAPTTLLGRDDERQQIVERLADPACRLVTLVGPGGIGKTRLAIDVATRLRDSFAAIYFVDLAPVSDPSLVLQAIARTLAARETADQSLLDSVKSVLCEGRVLLLLDNFEHVIDAVHRVAELLTDCPQLKILVTSRQDLHLRGEQLFVVPPLALPDLQGQLDLARLAASAAVALFVERASQYQPSFILTAENAAAVAEICRRLDGLPLAIELAAARIRMFPPASLLRRLSKRLDVLTRGPHDLPARQQTLQNTLDWSYNLLESGEQTLFCRLAVFVGGWTLEAAEGVCVDTGLSSYHILDELQGLIDKQFIQQESHTSGEQRFRMLDTIREYAQAHLVEQGETPVRQRHAAYYLALAETAAPALNEHPDSAQLAQLEAEYDNLFAAYQHMLECGESETSLRLCNTLARLWEVRGQFREARHWLQEALALPGDCATDVRVDSLELAGRYAVEHNDWPQAVDLFSQALALSRTLGDRPRIARLLRSRGWLALMRGKYAKATGLLDESLALYQALGDDLGVARVLGLQGQLAYEQSDFARAIPILQESLALSRAHDDHVDEAWSLNKLGLVALYQGNIGEADALFQRSLALFETLAHSGGTAWVLGCLGWVRLNEGDVVQASRLFEDSLARYRDLGEKRNIAFCLERLASLAITQGHAVRAARLFGAAHSLRDTYAVPLPPVSSEYLALYRVRLSAALASDALAAAWAEGVALSTDQAMEYALEQDALQSSTLDTIQVGLA